MYLEEVNEVINRSDQSVCSQGLKPVTVLLFNHKYNFACDYTPHLIAFGEPLTCILDVQGFGMTTVTCRRMSTPTWQEAHVLYVHLRGKYMYTALSSADCKAH